METKQGYTCNIDGEWVSKEEYDRRVLDRQSYVDRRNASTVNRENEHQELEDSK